MNNAVNINSSEKKVSAPQDLTALRSEKYIVFSVYETFYGIAAKEVTEIIHPITVTALPNVPRWILGVINLRGEIVAVVDLQTLWNKNSATAPKSKFIVARSGASAAVIAFAVDKLSEIVSLSAGEINPASDESAPYIFGKAVYKSNALQLIDAKNLFDSLSPDK